MVDRPRRRLQNPRVAKPPGWDDQERLLAAEHKGRRQPGSGSGSRHKGDVTEDLLLIEAKTTGKESISIKREWVLDIRRKAAETGQLPALTFGFDDQGLGREDWTALPSRTAAVLAKIARAVRVQDFEEATRLVEEELRHTS